MWKNVDFKSIKKKSLKFRLKYERMLRKCSLKSCPDCGFPMWLDSPHEICSGCIVERVVASWLSRSSNEPVPASFCMKEVIDKSRLLSWSETASNGAGQADSQDRQMMLDFGGFCGE